MEEGFVKPRTRGLLEHFGAIKDSRQPCKVMYPLPEVLLLAVCATHERRRRSYRLRRL